VALLNASAALAAFSCVSKMTLFRECRHTIGAPLRVHLAYGCISARLNA
jgi:hypothetical protein